MRTGDWTAASLTSEQLDYAAADVAHLLTLLGVLHSQLADEGLARLYDDCCEFLPARVLLDVGGYPDVFAY